MIYTWFHDVYVGIHIQIHLYIYTYDIYIYMIRILSVGYPTISDFVFSHLGFPTPRGQRSGGRFLHHRGAWDFFREKSPKLQRELKNHQVTHMVNNPLLRHMGGHSHQPDQNLLSVLGTLRCVSFFFLNISRTQNDPYVEDLTPKNRYNLHPSKKRV